MSGNCDKNPAAVALGKRRQAAMTDEERAAFGQASRERLASRTPIERRAIARKAAMTRRRSPKWLAPVVPIRQPAAVARPQDVEALARELADLPDELIERMAKALADGFET